MKCDVVRGLFGFVLHALLSLVIFFSSSYFGVVWIRRPKTTQFFIVGDPQFVQLFNGWLREGLKSLMEIVVFKLGEWEKNLRVAVMNILTLKKGTRSARLENRLWIAFFFCVVEFWWENWKVTIASGECISDSNKLRL